MAQTDRKQLAQRRAAASVSTPPNDAIRSADRDEDADVDAQRPNSRWRNFTILFMMLALVLGSGLMVVQQSFQYRQEYRTYNQLLQQKEQLNAEWGRLLIEQQTFGATAQIGAQAVLQLRMYSPPIAKTVIVNNQ